MITIRSALLAQRLKTKLNDCIIKLLNIDAIKIIVKNDEIKHAIRNRDMHHKNKDWMQYKYWRNHTTHLIRKSKKQFFSNAIAENKDNAYIWKHIKGLGGQTTDSKLPKELTIDDTHFDNPLDIIEKVNTYFSNISDRLKAAKINDHNNKNKEDFGKLKTYIEILLPSEVKFRIPFMKQNDVISNVQSLDITKATGIDGMTPKLLKTSAEIIGPNLLKIINISIKKWSISRYTEGSKIVSYP